MSRIPIVDDCMATELVTFKPNDNIHAAAKILIEKGLSGAPVVNNNGKLIGVLSKKDCLQVVYTASYHQEWGGSVAEYMTPDPDTIESGSDIIEAADRFVRARYRRLPVMQHGKLVGQVSRTDILQALYDHWHAR